MRFDQSINRFRARRGRILQKQISDLANRLGRSIVILDVGGRPDYWLNVGTEGIERILLINLDPIEQSVHSASDIDDNKFFFEIGDARNLLQYDDKAFDLVHSNSVIEHVGGWSDMSAMAREVVRVGRSGWIQTPAWEFPIEPHFQVPFVHWVGKTIGTRLFSISPLKWCRDADQLTREWQFDHIYLLSQREVRRLFPECNVQVEWLVFPKSYVIRWMSEENGPG